ncbi:Sciellin [Camelus dromedarius]|uniref:Sciellin n=1 Tax=Camelus dromedarius TaxID=9838 RepID=A0A5N4D9H4_CAMDR|nr:Sciellin [Camelus dromedarius]
MHLSNIGIDELSGSQGSLDVMLFVKPDHMTVNVTEKCTLAMNKSLDDSLLSLYMKGTNQGITLRQQGFHEVNKRRALLQDNSWIKKRPEEERDENYGRAVLQRHNSHDALDRNTDERDEPKATISRYRSDDTLDRISDRNDAAKTYKANTLDNRLTNRY